MQKEVFSAGRLLKARWGVTGAFFVLGFILASWVTFIPAVQQRLALSEGALGGALFAVALGAVVAVVTTGQLIQRFGSRAVTVGSGVFYCLMLPAPVFSESLTMLTISLFGLGLGLGSMDVAMNAQAASVEAACAKPLMSGFHGMYSIGNLAGAGAAAAFFAARVSAPLHVGAVVAGMLAVCAGAAFVLLPVASPRGAGPSLGIPHGPLIGLSIYAFLIYVGEGALVDWTTVYLASDMGLGASLAVSGFAAFAGLMAAGRFVGDRVIAAWGRVPVALGSAALAAIGLAAAVSTANLALAVVGFGVAGLGFANLIPILYSTAARTTPDSPQSGIAGVAGIGYVGLVAGPPMIGFLAEALSLRGALLVVAGAMAFVALAVGPALRRASGS